MVKTGWVWFGVINRSRVKIVKKGMGKATEHTERNKKTICNKKNTQETEQMIHFVGVRVGIINKYEVTLGSYC